MPANAEQVALLAQLPDAQEAFMELVEEGRTIKMPDTLAGNMVSGVIPMPMLENDVTLAVAHARARIAQEHERVLCTRYDDELDSSIDPTPDPAARKYLHLIGLVDPGETLQAA